MTPGGQVLSGAAAIDGINSCGLAYVTCISAPEVIESMQNKFGDNIVKQVKHGENSINLDKKAVEMLSGKTRWNFPSEWLNKTFREILQMKNTKGIDQSKVNRALKLLKQQERLNQKI